MRKKIHGQIFLFSCMAIAFFLPIYGKVVPVAVTILVLNWFAEGRFMMIPLIFREKSRLYAFSFAAFYAIYLIGMLYTSNIEFGLFDLEIKLSFFIFPLVFATLDPGSRSPVLAAWVFYAFVAGCFTASMILLGIAVVDYIRMRDPIVFYYTHFSRFVHTSYLAMYFNLAIAYIGYLMVKRKSQFRPVLRLLLFLLLFLFSLEVFLLSSKAGIFSLIVVYVLIILNFMTEYRNFWKGMLLLLVTGSTFFIAIRYLPVTAGRFKGTEAVISDQQGADNDKQEGTRERLVVWKASLEVIRENPLLGVGTGDVKDEMMAEYQREGKHVAYSMQLDSHNQYLQTYIATGLAGFLILLLILGVPAFLAITRKYFLYLSFLAVFAMNLLVESMLEVQAGVVYFVFFNSLLFFCLDHQDQVSDTRCKL
jgi:O-antigen ligase